MKLLKTLSIQFIVVVLFAGAMFGLNFITGPIIEANNQRARFDTLKAVMPKGALFDESSLIYSSENPEAWTLQSVPSSVLTVYKEKNDLGYAIRTTAESSYSTAPMEITIGITSDGKICGVSVNSYNDTPSFDFRVKDPNYLNSYIGKDSALADIGTVAGSTYSSTAFKNSVSEAMGVLITNNKIQAGVKSDAQILTELIPTVAPGLNKTEEVTASGNIQKALKATNGAGFAYVVTEGEASYLAIVNAMGVCKVYDVDGADVTLDKTAIVTEAKTHASTNQTSYLEALTTKVGIMMSGATDITSIELTTFNSVVSAVEFTFNGAKYYAFYSRSIGFKQMDVYVVIDANGAIAKVDAKQLIFEEQYFFGFGGVPADYKQGFIGITSDTWTGDQAIIAGATMSTNAMKQSVTDSFESFSKINQGGQN